MMKRACVVHGFTPNPRSCRRHERPVVHLELQTEPLLHLVAPLQTHRRRRDDQDQLDLLPQQQLLQHEPGLDRLSETDVVRDEQVRARQLQRLLQRRELVIHELDARAERRLEEPRIGGGDRVPSERVQVGREVMWRVELAHLTEAMRLGLQDAGTELELPEDLERPALVVVVETDQPDARRVARDLDHVLDQVLPVPDLHDRADLGHLGRGRPWPLREQRTEDVRILDEPTEHPRREGRTRPAGVVDPVRATRLLELVPGQEAREGRQIDRRRAQEPRRELLLRSRRRQHRAKLTRELRETNLG
jgi:hypothetical protein